MTEELDLVLDAVRKAAREEAIRKISGIVYTIETCQIITLILLALILWRVW